MDSPPDQEPQESVDETKKIEFRFCKECANMLYPREDRENGKLYFQCRNCQFSEEVGPVCIYRNELAVDVGETSGVTADVASDPTVGEHDPIIPSICTFCGQEILCPDCGEPTDGGLALEVDAEGGPNDHMVESQMEREVDDELLEEDEEESAVQEKMRAMDTSS